MSHTEILTAESITYITAGPNTHNPIDWYELEGILKGAPAVVLANIVRTRKRLHEGALEWVWKAEVAVEFGVIQFFGAAEVGTVECATLGKVIQTNKSHTVSITQSPNNPDGAILTIEEAA
jgi:hypothetical protein